MRFGSQVTVVVDAIMAQQMGSQFFHGSAGAVLTRDFIPPVLIKSVEATATRLPIYVRPQSLDRFAEQLKPPVPAKQTIPTTSTAMASVTALPKPAPPLPERLVTQLPRMPTKEEMSKVPFKGPPPKREGEVQAGVQPKPKALRFKSPPPGIDEYKSRQTAVEVKAGHP
jgi:hypothetical protein